MAKHLAKPKVRFTQKAYQQMHALTKECSIEISAMGITATDEQRNEWGISEPFYVMEFFVPDQECSAASTVMEDDSYAELSLELRDKGISPKQINVWWHSHVNMGTGHSSTDEKQIEEFGFDDVCISIITNKKGDMNVRVDQYSPFRYSFEGCSWTVDQINILEDGWAKKMVEEHVSKPAPQVLNIKKSTSFSTRNTHNYVPYNKYTSSNGYYGNSWNSWKDWDEEEVISVTTATDDSEEEVSAVEYVKEELHLPTELELLQELYDENIIDIKEVLEFHAKWYAKEMSSEEIVAELDTYYYESDKNNGKASMYLTDDDNIQEYFCLDDEEDESPKRSRA